MGKFKKIDSTNIEDIIALTPLQEGMLFHYLQAPGSESYFEQLCLEISGEIDKKIFEKAWNVVIETNEMLRTVFRWEKLEKPTQVVLKRHTLYLRYEDFSSIGGSEEQKKQWDTFKQHDRSRRFDLRLVPFRVILGKMSQNRYQMIISNHHILYDGWSTGIILKEFFQAYETLAMGSLSPVPRVKPGFKEFIRWHREQDRQEQKKFWRNYLEGFDTPTRLPVKQLKQSQGNPGGENYRLHLQKTVKDRLEVFVKEKHLSLAAVFYSAWGVLLQKYCGMEDVLFGITVSGRSAPIRGIENMVGLFINTIPLRARFEPGENLLDFLTSINNHLTTGKKYENTSLVDIYKCCPRLSQVGGELFDTIVSIENYPLDTFLKKPGPHLSIQSYSMEEKPHYDLTLAISAAGGIEIDFIYNNSSFTKDNIVRLANHFSTILKNIGENVENGPHEIQLLAGEERRRLLADFNSKRGAYPCEKTIPELFEKQAEQSPGGTALVGNWRLAVDKKEKTHITYGVLNEKSGQLARLLNEKGVAPNTFVGIMVERSIEMITGILGILKAGGAYVPLPIGPNIPGARTKYMLEECRVKILLAAPAARVKVGAEVIDINTPDASPPPYTPGGRGRVRTLTSTGQVNAANFAYVIFTSGSTGKPKAVSITHANLSPLLHWGYRHLALQPADRTLQNLSYYFDWSVWEIFITLTSKACLVSVSDEILLNPEACITFMDKMDITVLHATPTQYSYLLRPQRQMNTLKYLLLGAEKLSYDLAKRSFARVGRDCRVFNMYGPTECTIIASTLEFKPSDLTAFEGLTGIPIGVPAGNTGLLVLDQYMMPCPVNVAGELHIAGDGTAAGYLNNPELTAEKFDHDLWHLWNDFDDRDKRKKVPGKRFYKSNKSYILYKTGDLSRWLPDGNIEFLGRMDFQVKIRGFRIELGEIEAHLLNHPMVRETVVIAGQTNENDKYLCAYIRVSEDGAGSIAQPVLKDYLSGLVPHYMIPSYFVQLEKIPLTSSGKIDRKALPAPGIEIVDNYVAPRDEIEMRLVGIWSEVLGIEKERIGIENNFFHLGGHSLKATMLMTRIHKEFQVKIPLARVFNSPTIKRLAKYISQTGNEYHISIKPTEEKEYYPLSSAQKRLYILHRLASASIYYNIPQVIRLAANPDKEKSEMVFQKLIARHESLRTSFKTVKEEPVQEVHREVDFSIGHDEIGEAEDEYALANFTRPFDLSKAPLLRVNFITDGVSRRMLFIDMHHIITDGTSQEILRKEFEALYWGEQEELPALRIQYKDYSQWLNSKEQVELRKQQQVYWLKEFSGEAELPVLNLPTDYPRPFLQSFEGNWVGFALNARETRILKDTAGENGVTLYMVLLAVFNILFSKLSGQDDIILGTPIAARRHSDLRQVIGMMANTLPMRNYPGGNKTFNRFLNEVKQRTLGAYENQEYPFEELVEHLALRRDTGRNPLFDVMLNLLNQSEYWSETPGAPDAPPYQHRKGTSRFDMLFSAIDMDERIHFFVEYSTRLYTPGTIERLIRYLKNIILSLAGNPGQQLWAIEYIPAEEKNELLEFCSGVVLSDGVHHEKLTVHREFEVKAGEAADRTALVFEDRHLGYGELNLRSHRLAGVLREKSVQADMPVGVLVERSLEMIIALLAVLKAGAAYVGIDPEYPRQRILTMLEDSSAALLLTRENLVKEKQIDQFPGKNFEVLVLPGATGKLWFKQLEKYPGQDLESRNHAGNLLYVIYTSGSTGMPKGVMLEHGNLLNLIRHQYSQTNIEFDRVLQFTTISFDVSAQEIFSTLLAGGRLVLVSKETLRDIPALLATVTKERIKTLFAAASFLKFVINEENYVKMLSGTLTHIVTAGEQVIVNERFRQYLQENRVYLHNHYGPSETHVVTALTIDPSGNIPQLPCIGRPIANTVIYIFDKGMRLVPPGVAGQLTIAGMQVGRGYLNNPELTAQKFPRGRYPQPVKSRNKQVALSKHHMFHMSYRSDMSYIYKTGDLARWLRDGTKNLEFLGRMDHQVKIRGFRVELGEIESRLLNYGTIKECVVLAREDEKGGKYLCAYIVAREEIEISRLREYLQEGLPDYMIPAYFVMLDRIPLTPNRKVDRRALPLPVLSAADNYIAPAAGGETQLARIWAEVLHIAVKVIGAESNFFQLGGHSLTAAIMAARVQKKFQVKLPLMEIFRTPTPRGLARYLEGAAADEFRVIEPVEKKEYYALSSAQARLYILQQMDKQGIGYNMPSVWQVQGNVDKLETIFQRLIRRHQSLRTSFHMVNDEAVQRIQDEVNLEIEYYDMREVEVEVEVEEEEVPFGQINNAFGSQYPKSQELRAKSFISSFIRYFDLSRAPLFRVGLIKIEEEQYILMVDMHHIIADGISISAFIKEFTAIYGEKKPAPLRIQYKDFSGWQRHKKQKEAIRQQEVYWLAQWADEIPVLNLATDYPRPALRDFAGNSLPFELDENKSRTLKSLAAELDVTLFMLLLCIYITFLSKLSGQEDIVVGTPTAGRRHADLENIIGMFVNTLALRNFPLGQMPFIDLLAEVKERTLAAFENQDYPFEDLVEQVVVERDSSRSPLFDTMFVLQNIDAPVIEIPGLKIAAFDYENRTSKFDLTLTAIEAGEKLLFIFEYNTALFKEETIERLIRYFKKVQAAVIENKAIKLEKIAIIPGEETKQLVIYFNDTAEECPTHKTIYQLFEARVDETPDHVALVFKDETLTFRQLDERANRLANYLIGEKCIRPGDRVAVLMDRSVELIVTLMGVMKAGGAYVPLDVSLPGERLRVVFNDASIGVVVSRQKYLEKLAMVKSGCKGLSSILSMDGIANELNGQPSSRPETADADSPAYVMYTSGSSGTPKGVLVEHRTIVNTLDWRRRFYEYGPGNVSLQLPPYFFDSSVTDIFTPLLAGARLVLVSEEDRVDLVELKKLITGNNVSHFIVVPAFYNVLLEEIADYLKSVKMITCAGEHFPDELIRKHFEKLPGVRIFNEYGPTENSVNSTAYELKPHSPKALIGKPIGNVRVYILDRYLCLNPIGITGEICLSGSSLARGYLNRPELTAEKFKRAVISHSSLVIGSTKILSKSTNDRSQKFLPNDQCPMTNDRSSKLSTNDQCPMTSDRFYRTGDMGKWLSDGNLEFLGRIDTQVKIRGIRVETGEIENHLMRREDIKEAVVLAHEGSDGEKYLCAYVVPVNGKPHAAADLKSYLSGKLPKYMIPSHFIKLEAIPLTPTGKINREALPRPVLSTKSHIAPGNRVEERLAEIWAAILDIQTDTIGSDSDFFQLGGHSLKATTAASRIHKAFNVKVPLTEIFTHPTLRGLAKYIGRARQEQFAAIEPAEKKEYYPLSPAQKRLHLLQQMDLPGTAYNLPQIITIEEPDIERFETAFKKLIHRHESLRTSFHLVEDQPVQRVHEEVEFEIEYGQVDEEQKTEDRRQEIEEKSSTHLSSVIRHLSSEFIRPFDLSRAPLLRSGLFKLADGTYAWTVDMHHIITDGASHAVLKDEFNMLYTGKAQDLSPLRLQYKDYAQWQDRERQSEVIKRQETYWLKEFDGEVPVLQLPTDYPRPFMQSFAGCTVEFTLSPQESQTLKSLAKETNATLYMSLLAVFNILLSKLSGQEDIIVGTPIMGRRHTHLERIIGMFVNTLAMRNQPSGEKGFMDFLSHVKERTLAAYENQEYQFEDLVDKINVVRDIGRNPVFDVMFNLLNIEEYTDTDDFPGNAREETCRYNHRKGTSKFDMTLIVVDLGERLRCWLEYCTKLFKPSAIERIIACFKRIIDLLSKNSEQELAQLEILTESEKQRILYEFNDTNAEYRQDITIHKLFARQVERTPNHIALIGQIPKGAALPAYEKSQIPNKITYRELNQRSDQLARLLIEKGVKPGTIVGIMVERSIEMVIGLLGILQAGGAYLPIEPGYPQERIDYMLKDSGTKILLTGQKITALSSPQALYLSAGRHPGFPSSLSSSLAYVIYTSGSTGRPKGVMVEQGSVLNLLYALYIRYPLTAHDSYLLKTSYQFDVSITELFGWFWQGGRLAILEPGGEKDPAKILEIIEKEKITHINFVPSMFNAFAETLETGNVGKLSGLKYIFLAGEALLPWTVEQFRRLNTVVPLENLYGPTEASVYASWYSLSDWRNEGSIPIGKPLTNVTLYILDKWGYLQPVGAAGELGIGGEGLARGYLNQPELTAGKFDRDLWDLQDYRDKRKKAPGKRIHRFYRSYKSYKSYISKKIYRTGDLARWLKDGNIEFLGRMDFQVKIRGFRIELGEIENRLKTHPGINNAIVIDRNDNERQYLCAYVTTAPTPGKGIPSTHELKEYLEGKLPAYMIPACFVSIEQIPLNFSGKVDRNQLPRPLEADFHSHRTYEAPVSSIQRIIAKIWQDVLSREKVGIQDNFFDLGGNSLDFIKISNKLKEKLDREIPVVTLFTYPTIRSLELYLTREQGVEEDDPGLIDEGKNLMRLTLKKLDNGD